MASQKMDAIAYFSEPKVQKLIKQFLRGDTYVGKFTYQLPFGKRGDATNVANLEYQALTYKLRKLVGLGLLEVVKYGRKGRYYVNPGVYAEVTKAVHGKTSDYKFTIPVQIDGEKGEIIETLDEYRERTSKEVETDV